MPNILQNLVIDRVDLVDEGANSASFIEFYKRKEQTNSMDIKELLAKLKPEEAQLVTDAIAKASEEAIAKAKDESASELKVSNEALAKANEELEALKKAAEEAAKADDASKRSSFDEDEILKSMPEPAKAEYMKMKVQKEAAEEEIRKAKDAEIHATAVAKATELKALPVPTETLVAVLKGSTPEMVDVLTAVSSALESAALGEVGKRGPGKSTDTSEGAWGEIEKAAEEIAKAESITKQKAIGEVIKRKPELYKAYLDGGAN